MLSEKMANSLHRENIYKYSIFFFIDVTYVICENGEYFTSRKYLQNLYSTFLFVGVTYTYNPFDFMVTDIFNGYIDIDRGCSLIIAR